MQYVRVGGAHAMHAWGCTHGGAHAMCTWGVQNLSKINISCPKIFELAKNLKLKHQRQTLGFMMGQ